MKAKHKRTRLKPRASGTLPSRDLIKAAMKKAKAVPAKAARFLVQGKNGHNGRNGADGPASKAGLEAAIQRYVDLFDFAPVAYVSIDRTGRIEEINLAAARLLGLSRKQLIGSAFASQVVKTDVQFFLHHLLRCRASESRIDTELQLRKHNGNLVHVCLSSSPMISRDAHGVPLYQTAIVDLTARQRAEEATHESEERYRTLFDLVPVAVYTCDPKGLILEFNQRAVELWGREPKINPREKFCGSFKIFYPNGQSMPHKDCPMARVLRGEKLRSSDLEILVERENGERRNVAVSPTALKNERGKIIGAINCLYDVTESKKAEAALRESEELHRALVSQTAVGMARSNIKGKIVFVNAKFCKLLGYRESELIGKSILEITHPDDIAESRRLFQRMFHKGKPYQLEKRYLRKDGSILWVSVSASPMQDRKCKTQAAVAVIIDIGDRRKAQAALEEAKNFLEDRVREQTEELQAANRELKKEIKRRQGLEGKILEVSDREQQRLGQELHDGICQHLTAVSFMAQSVALRLKDHRAFQVEDIEKIAQLVNDAAGDVRNLARGLHCIDVDADGLLSALQNLVDREIWKIPCRLEVKQPFHIEDDEAAGQLYRIAREAVINAAKHAQANEIVIELSRGSHGIILSVTDDGVGMPAEANRTRGMGFHIMRNRALSAGGYLEVQSPRRGGTRITCCLPKRK